MATGHAEDDEQQSFTQDSKGAMRENIFGRPLRAVSAKSLDRGDHIIYQVTEEPYRACYESALVSSVREDQITLLKNTQEGGDLQEDGVTRGGGVTQVQVSFSDLKEPHIIQYTEGLSSNKEAIDRAEQRLKWGEKRHHVLYNNSHHFVTWAKTGKENPLTEITKELQYEGDSYRLDPVLTMVPVHYLDDIHPGDHLMNMSEHWLVESINHSQNTYTVYMYSGDEVSKIEQKWKVDSQQNWLSSDEFVIKMKTGQKYSVDEQCPIEDKIQPASVSQAPFTKSHIHSLTEIHPGDHIMITSQGQQADHLLIVDTDLEGGKYSAYTTDHSGKVKRIENKWENSSRIFHISYPNHTQVEPVKAIANAVTEYDKCSVFRIDYGGGADIYPAGRAIENAVEEYQKNRLSSDKFVTKMKTGQKHSLDEQCLLEQPASESQASFTKSRIHSLEEIHPGDHIMITSRIWQAKHLLIVNTDLKGGKYSAYTTDRSGKVERIENKWEKGSSIFHISYPDHTHSTLVAPVEAIDNADDEYHKWKSSDEFVTMMKTGKCYSLTRHCLFSSNNNIVGYTVITPDTALDEGDHIIFQDELGMYHSVFLYKKITGTKFAIMPNIKYNGDGCPYIGEVDLAHDQYQTYRINYKQCLPPEVAQIRACSKIGKIVLKENMHDPSLFISWAKTGKQLLVSRPDDLKIRVKHKSMPTQKQPQQIAQLRPWWYEKIISTDEIKVGDHLIRSHLPYWFHCMVTEKCINSDDRTRVQFKVICQFRTIVEEKELSLDPSKELVYRIKYIESFPAPIAIERAKNRLGKYNFSPMARMQFIRWAKTGSEEGIEVKFLSNEALPVSKSRIWSFGQLNRGDYLVEIVGKLNRLHHYLVTKVESPTICLAIESWSQFGTAGRVIKTTVSFEDSHEFYRINYNHGVCFITEDAVKKAESLVGSSTTDKLWSDINRKKFVNFVKTGESEEIDVSQLNDDRVLLPRRRVESALELKQGDHLERPLHIPGLKRDYNHHMMVIETINKHRCKVLHFAQSRMFNIGMLEQEVDLFEDDCVFRIHYSERINPAVGIDNLRKLIGRRKPQTYSFLENNCEHFVMTATIGHQMSIQVDDSMEKALQYRHVLQPIQFAFTKASVKGGMKATSKLSVHGVTILAYATKAAGQATTKAGSKAAFKAGAKAGAKAAFKLGYRAAASGTAVGVIGGVAVGANMLFEGPLLARGLYKLHRQHKFNMISDADFNRGIIKQSFTTGNTIVGGVGGALVGQVAIPVPILGAAVGGMVGGIVGQGCGVAEGWVASQFVHSKIVTLPIVITLNYTEYIPI